MIGSVKGRVAELANEYCLIETPGGVGYRVFMPSANLAALSMGSEVRVYTYTSVREDAILLFGFLSKQYYDLFVLLIGISGVGPKVALGILSAVKPDDFYMAVENRDMKALTKLPGIGKKTAERLLLELKDKISGGSDVIDAVFYPQSDVPQNAVGEAIEALQALGYSNSEIVPALKTVSGYEAMACEDIIKQVLKVFAGRK
ncbi:MAG: Holliday junction branch migration protein RuvA [Phascolarctobacterium sp.]|nr:MAG: Holliday junction branch migration protein RuvA [Phascolarctobacterium sp.]